MFPLSMIEAAMEGQLDESMPPHCHGHGLERMSIFTRAHRDLQASRLVGHSVIHAAHRRRDM